jgi:hemoglobin
MTAKHLTIPRLAAFAMLTALGAGVPAHAADNSDMPVRAGDDRLFKGLGGMDGLTKIVDNLTKLSLADDRIKATFDDINIPRFKGRLVQQLCVLSGGPCAYKGRSMAASHKALKITESEFNALAEDLQTAMEQANVPYWTQNRLIVLLAPMERAIVTR